MPKISIQNAGKYSQTANDFFSLENDGDVKKVRFLYQEPDGSDMDYYLVHEVEIDGKKRYVACKAVDDNGELHPEDCPLCQAGYRRVEKLFLQLYVEDEDKVKTWDRGRNFVPKIMTYINRYGSLVAQPIEIERRGEKGSTSTTYELFPLDKDNKTVEDFPEKQELLGSFILDLTEDELYQVIDGTYVVPGTESSNNNVARRGASSNRRTSNNSAPQRRTPSRGARSRSTTDTF